MLTARAWSASTRDGAEEVGVEVVRHSLEDRRDPFQPRPGVHRRLGERRHHTRRVALELHEDEVPDFQRLVARPVDELRSVAREIGALVVVKLRTGTAGPGLSHGPEVVLLAETQDSLFGQVPLPEARGFVVLGVDAGPEALRIESVALFRIRRELPCEVDRLVLEVVAEGEVAEHLEERVVAPRVAHVVQIIVLSARADALLRGSGPHVVACLASREDVLELVHPGVGEEQRRVLRRDERRRRNAAVSPLLEELQEPLTDLGRFHRRHESPS
jgi:hypothetical protein